MNNQYITVNLIPNLSTPAVACVSQYDVGRTLVFRVYNGVTSADLTGTTAVAVGTKKSGLGFSVTGTISGNTVTFSSTLEMTQESGMIPAEIRFSKTGENIGTANFTLAVEPSPHLDGTTDGTHETMADLQSQLNALDTRVDALEAGQSGGLSSTAKQLILTLFSKAAYAEDDAGTAYDALEELWTTTTRTITYNLSHVSSSNSTASIEQGQSYTTTLTASTNYTLNSVSVTMGGVDITSTAYSSGTVSIPSVTGNIVITATAVLAAQSITATYTQSGTVYDTDSLDSLKADLVVTANYSGGTSATVPSADYTLSGTLTAGTSTVTVTYSGLTTTFNVTVTANPMVLKYNFDFTQSLVDSVASNTATLGGSASRSSSGVSLTTASDTITFASPLCTSTGNVRIEVDIGNASKAFASGHGRLVTWNSGGTMGLIYRSTGRWEVYQSSWITPTDAVTDATYIADNTVIIEIGPSTGGSYPTATANVYIGDKTIASNITVKTYAGATDGATSMKIGSTGGNTFYNVTIKAIRVYENNGE